MDEVLLLFNQRIPQFRNVWVVVMCCIDRVRLLNVTVEGWEAEMLLILRISLIIDLLRISREHHRSLVLRNLIALGHLDLFLNSELAALLIT